MHVTGAFSKLLAPGLRTIAFQAYEMWEAVHSRIFNMLTSTRAYEEDLEMAGLAIMPTKNEGEPITYQQMIQGAVRRYTNVTYGLGFRVTLEMMEDDRYRIMGPKQAKELGKAAYAVREVVSSNVFNNGTDATLEPGFKSGEPLFSNSHTLHGGGTQDNLIAADLGVESFEAMLILLSKMVDERGIPITQLPSKLVVPIDLQFIAEQLLGSDRVPFSANNTKNVFKNRGIEIIVNPWLTDTDSFFLLGRDHDLNFFNRMPLKLQSGDDFDTGDAKYKGVQRFSVGHGCYRGAVGSYGAA